MHACIRPSVCTCVCVKNMHIVCHQRGSSLMRSPASQLYVKPLHCSTASGISAGTALFFFSLQPSIFTIERLNLGQIPPAWKACAHTCTSPSVHTLRSGELRAAERPPKSPVGSLCPTWIPSPPPPPASPPTPPPLFEWEQQSWRATCLGDRHRQNERLREREKRKHGILGGSAIQVLS